MPSAGASSPHDLDRELNELLQELRVVLPGIQVLFAFLLAVPFSNQFHSAGSTTETAYFVAFAATTLASFFTLAPSVQHRLRWRRHDKEALLRYANREMVVGTALIGVAIVAVVFLVSEFLYGVGVGIATAAVSSILVLALWYALPLAREQTGSGGD